MRNRYVIDSWAWIEYLNGTKKGFEVREKLEKADAFTTFATITEVVSSTVRNGGDANVSFGIITTMSKVVKTDEIFAMAVGILHASMKKTRPNFSYGDANALQCARDYGAKVLTNDSDFKGLKEAEMLS